MSRDRPVFEVLHGSGITAISIMRRLPWSSLLVSRIAPAITKSRVLSDAVRGQYGGGGLDGSDDVCAYREEQGIAADSSSEAYVAMKLMIDSWRCVGGPFLPAHRQANAGALFRGRYPVQTYAQYNVL